MSQTRTISRTNVVVAQSEPTPPVAAVAAPAPLAEPAPLARVTVAPAVLAIAPNAMNYAHEMTLVIAPPAFHALLQAADADKSTSKSDSRGDYIDQMRAAGYSVDLDKYMAMKIQGVTPEFARSMAATGFGKPTADELIAMKIHGVSPSEVAELKAAGIDPGNYQDLITYRIFRVTPEFVAGMKSAGFSNISAKKLVELRIQNVTPEFAKSTKQQWPDATVDQMVQLRIFNINGAFIASAKRHGLEPLTIDKLVRLRISGILDDESRRGEEQMNRTLLTAALLVLMAASLRADAMPPGQKLDDLTGTCRILRRHAMRASLELKLERGNCDGGRQLPQLRHERASGCFHRHHPRRPQPRGRAPRRRSDG